MAAMNPIGLVDPDGRLTQRGIDYYVARAKGGTGLITTGLTCVSRELEVLPTLVASENIHVIVRLSELAEAVHDYGAKLCVQLTAGHGRVLPGMLLQHEKAVAPSVLPCYWNPKVTTRELTIQEIERLVNAFESGARAVKAAGVDAVELHAHEGYLLDQFQTALWNKRTDKYGGNLQGRLRFPIEVIEAVRKGAGADFPIIYRFGLKHYLEGGREIDEGLEIARRMESIGVDCLHVDAGCYETWHWAHPTSYQPPGCMVDMAKLAKEVVKIPVIAVGKLGYPDLAESVLQEGKADFICLGRTLLADPEWPNKVRERRAEDIRPCINDNEGCHGRIRKHRHVSCTVNPATGMEREFVITPAEEKKKVLVVGGGPAGMEAARTAALRGHEVSLWEKSDALGGNMIPASTPDLKQDYRMLIEHMSTQMKKAGVRVELGREATPESIQKVKPRVVFVATGATPIIPEIPGVGKRKVITAVDLLLGKKEARGQVVVVGGGLVGSETALYLAQKGMRTILVEALSSIAYDVFKTNRLALLEALAKAGVEFRVDTSVLEITDEGITVADVHGRRDMLKAETVVLAVGLKPDQRLLDVVRDKVPEVYAIGDCVEPGKVLNAIWDGFRTARIV